MTGNVSVEIIGAVAVVTLERPHVRNAVDKETSIDMAAALDQVDADPAVRAVVLTGRGSVFCAGMDLKAFAATGERPLSETRGGLGIVERPPAKPTIAAVEGQALGGGFEMALACDLIVAAEDALLGLPEVTHGLMATGGGVLRLAQRIPRNVALEMILTGKSITASELRELGLVNRVAAPGEALAVALQLAEQIAANAPLAVMTSKYLVNAAIDWDADHAFALQAPHGDRVRRSADAVEGARSFVEKRVPQWTGS